METKEKIPETLAIPIKFNTTREFFQKYVAILRPIIGIRKGEADVLAELLVQYYANKDIRDEEKRHWVVFSYESRKQIEDRLEISDARLRNCLTVLRNKGIITSNKITKYTWIDPECKTISFNFNDGRPK